MATQITEWMKRNRWLVAGALVLVTALAGATRAGQDVADDRRHERRPHLLGLADDSRCRSPARSTEAASSSAETRPSEWSS